MSDDTDRAVEGLRFILAEIEHTTRHPLTDLVSDEIKTVFRASEQLDRGEITTIEALGTIDRTLARLRAATDFYIGKEAGDKLRVEVEGGDHDCH